MSMQHDAMPSSAPHDAAADAAWYEDPHEAMPHVLQAQARELGISPEDEHSLQRALALKVVTYQEVLGLTAGEMAAMAYRAEELLAQKKPRDALKIYLALNKLDSQQANYWRGTALCFHHLREYGMAHGYYGMALATDPQDRISAALRAECVVKLEGADAGIRALAAVLAQGPAQDPKHKVYLDRVQELHDRLRNMGDQIKDKK